MVSCKTPMGIFPTKNDTKNKLPISKKKNINLNLDKVSIKEELLDDLDEMNEDHINLLKDTELLQAISMTENDIENKFISKHLEGEELENVDNCESIKLSKKTNNL